ncbi:MAG: CDP-diacylglycerol--serine O-phosphatidyltransferase [Candidatus Coatesbacteria bacterium]|nr:MAG: CDP-diacylglycerol--serine O-phosphatidyltransferase [Candidatus Coatesbacteria bacterium]
MAVRHMTSSGRPTKREKRRSERQPRRKRIKIRISLLPGILTTANVLCGFYAIMWAMKGRFFAASAAIVVAAIVDAFDGRVARLTKTTSEFGVEFDSLADVISFGVAPVLLAYHWALSVFGRAGWVVAFAYLICAVLRLARFNTRCKTVEPKFFLGLPTPAAGLVVATSVLLADGEPVGTFLRVLFLILFICASYLMISNVKYRSFKQFDFAKMHPFGTMTLVVVAVIVIASFPQTMPFILVLGYVVWGLFETSMMKRRERRGTIEQEEAP